MQKKFQPLLNLQGIYKLLVSEDQSILCMDFNPSEDRYPSSLVNDSFKREISILSKIKNYKWSPEIIEIDENQRKIFIKWYGNTCEDKLPIDYKDQLYKIIYDLDQEKIYKANCYRKNFYVDDNDIIHAYSFYTSFTYDENPIIVDPYKPILNSDREILINKLAINGKLDLRKLIFHGFNYYIDWPDNPLPKIHKKIYG